MRKEMEQCNLEGSEFAMIIMSAKNADAAILKMLFWKLDVLFNIELGFQTPGTKTVYILEEKFIFYLTRLESSALCPPWLDFKKMSCIFFSM